MYSTKNVLKVLRKTNPNINVTEDQIRGIIRRSKILPPPIIAGRFIWSNIYVYWIAKRLGLKAPKLPDNNQSASAIRESIAFFEN